MAGMLSASIAFTGGGLMCVVAVSALATLVPPLKRFTVADQPRVPAP
jgi:hypothetical protein